MRRYWYLFLLAAGLLLLLCIFSLGLLNSRNNSAQSSSLDSDSADALPITLPITQRDFKVGTAGYIPADFPSSKISQISEFWQKVGQAGEVYGVHVDWQDTAFIESAVNNTDADLLVLLGFQKPEEWQADSQNLIITAKDLLARYRSSIKYLGIGNEVDILQTEHPAEFANFQTAYATVYAAIKQAFPDVKVFPTFQLEHLRGAGYLLDGQKSRATQWNLLTEFNPQMDLAVFTIYPFFDFTGPAAIPDDYLAQITQYTSKPLAFTETGWPSRTAYPVGFETLTDEGFAGSEQEQLDYLLRLINLADVLPVEFINWAFIHDPYDWEQSLDTQSQLAFSSIGLNHHNGDVKPIWNAWLQLVDLPIE